MFKMYLKFWQMYPKQHDWTIQRQQTNQEKNTYTLTFEKKVGDVIFLDPLHFDSHFLGR